MKNILLLTAVFLFSFFIQLDAQEVYENHTAEIYNYLARMAQKGIIDFEDHIRPLTRTYLNTCLDSVNANKNKLSPIEKQELLFYIQEYNTINKNELLPNNQVQFIKKDRAGRWRSMFAENANASIYLEPVFSGALVEGPRISYREQSSGFHFFGTAGKHFSYQFFANDINLDGKGYDTTRLNSSETGFVRKDTSKHNSLNYVEYRGSINYHFKNGNISFGQDHLLYGYGENGRVVLSDKAPAFPFLRFDYSPFPWLRFNNTHAWLNSKIIDSSKTYGTGNELFGGVRQLFIPKFMATHSVLIKAAKGLDISAGESIIYSDHFDVGYLIPVMFFKLYDQMVNNSHIQAGSNEQLFLNISSRNQLKNTHLYTSVFIDEIRISTIFDKAKSRNQLGYTIGGAITDYPIKYLTFNTEYTRINPFVYNNLIPAQTYTSQGYNLGDWMGSNSDRLLLSIKYTPIAKLKLMVRYQAIRKGDIGTIVDQYLQEPQPPFLFGNLTSRNELFMQSSYELYNGLVFKAWYSKWNNNSSSWSLGVNYGF